jgi:hypothetical protein
MAFSLVATDGECRSEFQIEQPLNGSNSTERSVAASPQFFRLNESRDSSVGIVTGYGLDDQGVGVRVPVGARIFTSPCGPDRLWGPPSLLSNG